MGDEAVAIVTGSTDRTHTAAHHDLGSIEEVAAKSAEGPSAGTGSDRETGCTCPTKEGCSCAVGGEAKVENAQDRPAQPHAGAATIVCNGAGGYRVYLGSWATAPCGTVGCVTQHENQHIADWQHRWPEGCKGKADGGEIPLGGPGYDAFLKDSECKAHTVDLNCANDLAKTATGDCVGKVKAYADLTATQKANYC
jgi:hypothetical protein